MDRTQEQIEKDAAEDKLLEAKRTKAVFRRHRLVYIEQAAGLAQVSLGVACISACGPIVLWFIQNSHRYGFRLAAGLAGLGVTLIGTGIITWAFGKQNEDIFLKRRT
jgi:hypothetical protein